MSQITAPATAPANRATPTNGSTKAPSPPTAANTGFVTNFAAAIAYDQANHYGIDSGTVATNIMGIFPPAALPILSGLAKAPYRHQVTLRIQGTAEQIRARLPASVASVEASPSAEGADPQADRCLEDDDVRDDHEQEAQPDHQAEIADRRAEEVQAGDPRELDVRDRRHAL